MSESRWNYVPDRTEEFPEAYFYSHEGTKIRIEVNREKRGLKLYAELPSGEAVESQITNGIVLEERVMIERTGEHPYDTLKGLSRIISSLPDQKVIRLIGGNYGVMTEFLGAITRYSNQDVQLLKRMFHSIINFPSLIGEKLKGFFFDVLEKPAVHDLVDTAVVAGSGYYVYQLNFNFLTGGAVAMAGALLSGYYDWFVRKKDPYVLKLVLIFVPAYFAVRYGLVYQ